MANESHSSDLVDPLHDHSGLSLFPRTFRDSMNAPKSNDPDDIESIHNYMKSMALRSPKKLLDQAKVIIDGGSELLNSKFASFVAPENKSEAVVPNGEENLRERRPGLGLKRARFSLKPNSSQPSVSLEPSLDIDRLQDPEQFFLAYEKIENAKKEIQRQTGGITTDLNDYNLPRPARRRRPGILGKSVSYKHLYPSGISENDNSLISSQETLEQDILCPSNYVSQQETTDPNVESQEMELAWLVNAFKEKTENRVNELLDELLSNNWENIDGDGALSLLQERLQIKPIDLEKLCLPDVHDYGRNDFMALGTKLSKPRKALSDVHNLVKDIKTPVTHKQVAKSPVPPLTSPTPPKSPFASIYLLKKRILKSNLSSDPFSALDVDLSPVRNRSPVEHNDEQTDQVNLRKDLTGSEKLKSPVIEKDNIAIANMGSTESSDIDKRLIHDNVSRPNTGTDVQSMGSDEMEEHVKDMPQEVLSSTQPDINIEDSNGPCTDFQTYEPREMEENVEDMLQKTVSSALPDINTEDSTPEKLKSSQSQLDQSSSSAVEYHPDIPPEQHIEKSQEHSRMSLNEQSKAKRPPREGRKRKALSRRQSLAEAGTFWETGLRRSSRIKMRPLEYWKGERFLYGRIHESLTTVIGVKYVSPAKGEGKPTLKVKSYVSDEYKELVDLAALH
ncbi:hypothetical protein F0562_024647 [Nyssa sinensis]|uniref:Centromere protein C n=1 Tax=Nyssa sinensis TaxID=561372 RepID=A0A5J5BCQ5_9ASTE|nr:hypothetical protein F0562_024647 [Nyssa sinensis]